MSSARTTTDLQRAEAAIDDFIGGHLFGGWVVLTLLTTVLCYAFVSILRIASSGPIDAFFTIDQSPDSTIMFLLSTIMGIEYIKYIAAINAHELFICNDNLMAIFHKSMGDLRGNDWHTSSKSGNQFISSYTSDFAILRANKPFPTENIIFMMINKAQSAYGVMAISKFRVDNRTRWYIIGLIMILQIFIMPIYFIGTANTSHVVFTCAVRSGVHYMIVCLMFQITYCAEQIANKGARDYVAALVSVANNARSQYA